MTLGKTRDGHTRLITTNFDRLFEEVIAEKGLAIECFRAPLLPVPKNRWDGLVYLHGLLTPSPTASDLDQLVVSSGDFGLAYLTERWAARFVSELFRGYTVCFVGYSINDPVLRYMMDALAADRLLGESPPEMFAFGSYSKGKEEERANEWRAKNVTPILYREHQRHAYLHRTLWEWAATYRDGLRGKERIVMEAAMARPLAGTKQDYFISRMLWALSDPSGLPAKRFAELDPVPSLDWLEPLSEKRFGSADLARFGISDQPVVDDKLAFSLMHRPSPYPLAPSMCIVDAGTRGSRWDEVMRQLAHWLIRHLNDPALLLWLVKRGGQIHDDLAWWIEHRLDELTKLERDGNTAELAHIREDAPNAIPGLLMRTLWRMLLTGRVKSWLRDFDLYRWRDRFKRDGLTATLRLQLREMLTPRGTLREPFRWPSDGVEAAEPQRIRDLVEWEVVLSAEYVHAALRDLTKDERWTAALPKLLTDFTMLLRDALDLMREPGGAQDRSDLSYIHQPSISEHPQNRDYRDWTALIELTRDAWRATAAKSPERAAVAAESWRHIPYPLFKRLAFFAAAQDGVIPPRRALDWLLADDRWWLWSAQTLRETIRLLVSLAPRLDETMLRELEQAVLQGPPREMFENTIEPEHRTRFFDGEIWLRLAKVAAIGVTLSADASARLAALSSQYQWKLAAGDRDEFLAWMYPVAERRRGQLTPRRRKGLVEWLKQHSARDHWLADDWRQRCHEQFPTVVCALYTLAKEGVWPVDRWKEAFYAWSQKIHLKWPWRLLAPVWADASDAQLQALTHPISYWLKQVAGVFKGHEQRFFTLARRILDLRYEGHEGTTTDDMVEIAINHPVGHVTEALLRWWERQGLEDGQGLPEEVKRIFTDLCNTTIEKFRHDRVLLASHVITLFRVDRDWTLQHLLPLFDWNRSETDARAAWQGFLWSPRLYQPLMEMKVFKTAFLDTASRYGQLGWYGKQYVALQTFAALDRWDTFTVAELATATRALPQDGLHEAAQALVRALEGAGDQRSDFWANRVVPYLRDIWPKNKGHASPVVAACFGRLCVAAGDAFPGAVAQVRDWLQPLDHPEYLVHELHESGLCGRFPEEALDLLSRVVGDQTQWPPSKLSACLKAIQATTPALETDQRFDRLRTYLRRHGQE
ncbi:MAG: SIR2 family protein [Nitrospira sp.]|nr:SIR2 family protein [Nitrospira sp.]